MNTLSLQKVLLAALTALALGACSTQNREAGPQVDISELNNVLAKFQTNAGGGKGVINFNFGSGSDSSIAYYAREQAGRPALSVASIYDLNAVDSRFGVGQGIWELSPVEADAVFIDSIEGSGRTFTLLIRVLTGDGQELYFSGASAPNNYTFADDVFETNISMSGGANLIVRSTDLSRDFKEELSDSIKLTLHIEQNGVLYKVGQISTMAGYGIR